MLTSFLAAVLFLIGALLVILGIAAGARTKWALLSAEMCAAALCIGSGLGLIGLAQALRVLIAINGKL